MLTGVLKRLALGFAVLARAFWCAILTSLPFLWGPKTGSAPENRSDGSGGGELIRVNQSAEAVAPGNAGDRRGIDVNNRQRRPVGDVVGHALMRTLGVVVVEILGHHMFQV